MADYSKLKVADLRDLLKDRDIPYSGLKKQELIDALEEDDQAAGTTTTTTTKTKTTSTKRKASSPVPAAPTPAKQPKKAKPKAGPPAAATPVDAPDHTPPTDAQFAPAGVNLDIPIDEGVSSSYHVYVCPDSGIIYDASLNQTNASNNNNKFYRLQLLESSGSRKNYQTWTRWGRVGEHGQSAMLGDGSLADAFYNFEKKFKDKSGLKWDDRGDTSKPKKYVFVERSYLADDEDDEAAASPDSEGEAVSLTKPKCTLEPSVQSLMELIFNQKHFANTMQSLNYDVNKLPLGKLSKATITKGFEFLKELSALMSDPSLGTDLDAYEDLSNQYYSYIPHAFGRNRPPIIRTLDMLKPEIELLDSLSDLKNADEILRKAKDSATQIHALDSRFQGLNMQEMSALPTDSAEFTEINQYLHKTCGATHSVKYEVQDIFRIQRQGEFERFGKSKYASVASDRRLLWHGSRTTNYGGILSQGLRIAPPEAPVNGYMFGKGIYLADMSSKSANYCSPYDSDGHALLLLCEAELGKPMQTLTDASYNAAETAKELGAFSTWGQGKTSPKAWKDAGCIHPSLAGATMPDTTQDPGDTNVPGAYLLYNEYICYDIAQVRLRYLLRVKINLHQHDKALATEIAKVDVNDPAIIAEQMEDLFENVAALGQDIPDFLRKSNQLMPSTLEEARGRKCGSQEEFTRHQEQLVECRMSLQGFVNKTAEIKAVKDRFSQSIVTAGEEWTQTLEKCRGRIAKLERDLASANTAKTELTQQVEQVRETERVTRQTNVSSVTIEASKAELEKASLKINDLALKMTKVKGELESVQKAEKVVEKARDRAESPGKMAIARLKLLLIGEDVNAAEFEQFLNLLVEMSNNTALASAEFPLVQEVFEGSIALQKSSLDRLLICMFSVASLEPQSQQLFAMLEALFTRVDELDAHKRWLRGCGGSMGTLVASEINLGDFIVGRRTQRAIMGNICSLEKLHCIIDEPQKQQIAVFATTDEGVDYSSTTRLVDLPSRRGKNHNFFVPAPYKESLGAITYMGRQMPELRDRALSR
ncbi:PARP-domain-containing protein [Aureobasidium subglaciale]|nr:PARP-domain-containing protein [Aureobasidium subglaciale]